MEKEGEMSLFPCNITLEECYAATKGFPGFRNVEKFDHIIFNYDFAFRQSFPDPELQETQEQKRLMAIRRYNLLLLLLLFVILLCLHYFNF
jgi:hypothetical protein